MVDDPKSAPVPDFVGKPAAASKAGASTSQPVEERPKKKKEDDIMKIREKHAQEAALSA